MATINSNDLKEGVIFSDDGSTFLVIKYSHIKKGRGQATIKLKVKNIETGSITILSYSNEQRVETADVEKRNVQYLYSDEKDVYFMDDSDYSQFTVPKENIEREVDFLKEGQKVVTMFLDGNPISIELPKSVELTVTETSDAVSGNTSSGAMKDAIVETGYKVQVPLFIKQGDILKINTDSGDYVARIN